MDEESLGHSGLVNLTTFQNKAEALLKEADEMVAKGRQKKNEARKIIEFWDELKSLLESGNPVSVVKLLELRKKKVKPLLSSCELEYVRDLDKYYRKLAYDKASRFQYDFPQAARRGGFGPDRNSRYPQYSFMRQFITVKVEEKKLNIRVTIRDGESKIIPLDIDAAVCLLAAEIARLKDELTRLSEDKSSIKKFLKHLLGAYRLYVKENDLKPGDPAPIDEIFKILQKKYYIPGEIANLSLPKLYESEIMIEGQRLRLDLVRDGKLLYGLENRGGF